MMGQCCETWRLVARQMVTAERLHGWAPFGTQPAGQARCSRVQCAGAPRRAEIQSQACAARVQKIMEYASSDIRFDVPLADACFEDRQEFCANVPPGSARVIRCLQDRCCATPRKCLSPCSTCNWPV